MNDKAKAMVLTSFIGDSLALGAHWIYSVEKIEKDFGRVENFLDPDPDSYHPTKKKGEFTHYGDQSFVLLESLAARGSFDPEDFTQRWQKLFTGYNGYYDQATKGTLENLSCRKRDPWRQAHLRTTSPVPPALHRSFTATMRMRKALSLPPGPRRT